MKIVRVSLNANWGSDLITKPTLENKDLDLDPNVDEVDKVKQEVKGKLRTYNNPKSPTGHSLYQGTSDKPTKYVIGVK